MRIQALINRYLEHCEEYYQESNEAECIELALRLLGEVYGDNDASAFGPKRLKDLRRLMVDEGKLTRSGINKRIDKIRRAWKWGVSEEYVPAATYQALLTVEGLRKGRTNARESGVIGPVADRDIQAVLPHVLPPVAAMIRIQRATGARPGEVCAMQGRWLDQTDDDAWAYRPERHKTAYKGRTRVLYLGPTSQEVIRPFLKDDPDAFLFSPREAMAYRWRRDHDGRVTPLDQGNRPGTNRKRDPRKQPGERYSTESYRKAIQTACDVAGIDRWSPNQIRKTAGTMVRREHGLEVAQAFLGHSRASTTEMYYAPADVELAKVVAVS